MEKAICKKCGSMFERPIKGYKKTYCSRSCANSRIMTDESNAKRRESVKRHWASLSIEEAKNVSDKRRQLMLPIVEKRLNQYQNWFMKADWEDLKLITKRRRVLLEQCGKCLICHCDEWMGNPITLELDHIDGNNKNNSRENLRFLCPNCHSQTDTWRGRNNTGNRNSNFKHGLNCK